MRILILGATGMLGHKLWQKMRKDSDVYATVRRSPETLEAHGLFDANRLRGGVDACQFDSVTRAVADIRPDVVVNCIGIIKQQADAYDPVYALTVNSIFPHKLKNLCNVLGARLIQLSTDCVFSGKKGNYTEDDESDATDLYGRSKFLGEVSDEGCLTIRTSIIGPELSTKYGLLEWFRSNEGGKVKGYTNAIFSGFPTVVLWDIIGRIIADHTDLSGVWHVSSDPISKHDLITLIKSTYGFHIDIEPDGVFSADRSLDSVRFRKRTGMKMPAWPDMVAVMAEDEDEEQGAQ